MKRYRFTVSGREVSESKAIEALTNGHVLEITYLSKIAAHTPDMVIEKYQATRGDHVLYIAYEHKYGSPGGVVHASPSPKRAVEDAKRWAKHMNWSLYA